MAGVNEFWTNFTWVAAADLVLKAVAIPAVLVTKKGPTSPVAWCLIILFMPLVGSLLFWIFGYSYLHRPLRRKRRHRTDFRVRFGSRGQDLTLEPQWRMLGHLGWELDDAPPTAGNGVRLFPQTEDAFQAVLKAVDAAEHHIHLEFYIFRADGTGKELLAHLTAKARQGVQVRLLYDSLGGLFLGRSTLSELRDAGGQVSPFLPLNLFRSRLRVNLRNHRKLVVVDGKVAILGGMNIGDEYMGLKECIGPWRDQMVRLEGPAVEAVQRTFVEDWDFTNHELLTGPKYFPEQLPIGSSIVQVLASGPDQDVNVVRELYFAAIASARQRVWMASPYFIPDPGLLDAIHLARHRGVNVRLLMPKYRDHFSSYYASRYYWDDLLAHGVEIYLFNHGMMHAKNMMVDGELGIVGSANLDQRSLHLNFELVSVLYDAGLTAELERSYLEDLERSTLVNASQFRKRPFGTRLAENAFRLFSPIL
jgi:cardiolipin synthase